VKAFDDQGQFKQEPIEQGLFQQVRSGHRRSIARLITYVENDELASKQAISNLYADTGKAHIIGIAIDPSSPFSGGAFLGDRVRMQDLSGDRGIFIRSMASRGRLGGLAKMTGNVVKILDAAGFDVILIETVGAGQAEVDIASTAHTTLVIEAPGMGDEIQSIKAGILEIADILVVNKADRPGSDRTITALKVMIHMGAPPEPVRHHGQMMTIVEEDATFEETDAPVAEKKLTWEVPVLASVAVSGEGIKKIVDKIQAHKSFLTATGEWHKRELARSRQEIGQLLQAEFMKQMAVAVPAGDQEALIEAVAERKIDPYTAMNRLFAQAKKRGWRQPGTG